MARIARYLIDTSAAARMPHPLVRARLEPLITGGVVASCATLDAEALYSARSPAQYEQIWADRRAAYEYLATEDEHWRQAFTAQRELARTGRHRAVGIADLLTGALAAHHRLTIIHYDADFEIAGEVLPFEHRWIAPCGSL
ncbi:MAG TPA: PIN domain-containing protein [Dehalococcoidia bacterium]